MFLGHFALALAAKKADNNISLGTTILSAQWLDLLWPVLLLTGTEKAAIAPAGSVVPLEFISYPVTHSLLTVVCWGALIGSVYFLLTKNKRGAMIVGLLVLSHWLLDWLVHVPDLPLTPFTSMKTGLGLWNYKIPELILELTMFAIGVIIYMQHRASAGTKKKIIAWSLIIFLLVVHIMNTFGQAPPSITAVAWVGLTQWILVAWGYWADSTKNENASLA